MTSSLYLQVRTPAETLLQVEEAHWVHVRLADGAGISVYPGHAPLLAETITAPLRYADASGEHAFGVRAGLLHIENDYVTVLTSGRSETPERPTRSPAAEARRFDRLAQQLRARLETLDLDVLENSFEEG